MTQLDAVLSCPTGPLHEQAIIEHITDYARQCELVLLRDAHQNLMLTYGNADDAQPALCVQVPLDQPGLEVVSVSGDTAEGLWHGPSPGPMSSGQAIALYNNLGVVGEGRVISFTQTADRAGSRPQRVLMQVDGHARVGDFGLPEGPAYLREGAWVVSRSTHGLVAVGAVLELFDRLQARRPATHFSAAFTRGSTLSAAGAIGLLQQGMLAYGQPVVCLSGHPSPPGISPGMGPVIVAGDARGLMDASVTDYLEACARDLARRSNEYDWQRALLDDVEGEPVVFRAHGHPTGAIVLPIHREDTGPGTAPPVDRVHLADYHTLIDLLEAVAQGWLGSRTLDQMARDQLDQVVQTGTLHLHRLR